MILTSSWPLARVKVGFEINILHRFRPARAGAERRGPAACPVGRRDEPMFYRFSIGISITILSGKCLTDYKGGKFENSSLTRGHENSSLTRGCVFQQ